MATKIKDGLFVGDAEASQDPEFIELNKITFVINCAGRQLPNLWEQYGLHYLTFPWGSDPDCVLFDGGNVVIVQIANFIDEAQEKGDSVLVHSMDGTGRCIACLTAYMMFRYRWGFEKALDFVCSKRPDAAPNPGFIQQLYHLDLRLCAQWYGPGREPPEKDRIRHDHWAPLSPDRGNRKPEQPQPTTDGRKTTARRDSNASGRKGRGGAATARNTMTARPGIALSPSASNGALLREIQDEELVLVHSFLNSQPQISALPAGRADYEDHETKELHWIDRPRIDKITAAGRLGPGDTRPHTVPVSPRTGRAVPERPSNSSYNALSRDAAPSFAKVVHLVGILKTGRPKSSESGRQGRNVGATNARVSPMAYTGALKIEASGSGGGVVSSPGAGGEAKASGLANRAGGGSARMEGQRKRVAVAEEVFLEDLIDARPDVWVGNTIIRGQPAIGNNPQRDHSSGWEEARTNSPRRSAADRRGESSLDDNNLAHAAATPTLDSGILIEPHLPTAPAAAQGIQPHRTTSARRMSAEDVQADDGGRVHPNGRDSSGESRDKGQEREPATFGPDQQAPAERGASSALSRQSERQAWDGGTGGEVRQGKNDSQERRSSNDRQGEVERQDVALGDNNTTNSAPRLPTAPNSSQSHGGRESTTESPIQTRVPSSAKWSAQRGVTAARVKQSDTVLDDNTKKRRGNGRDRGDKVDETRETMSANAQVVKSVVRRVGSEGNLPFSGTEVESYFPQAPASRSAFQARVPSTDSLELGCDQEMDTISEGRQENPGETVNGTGDLSSGPRQTPVTKEGREQELYLTPVGVGSLQQLAQTPNPQQRRLPSPRPHPDQSQGSRRHDASDLSHLFPQQRPTSAPSERPDLPEGGGGSGGNWAGGKKANPAVGEATNRSSSSKCVGTASQGYPVHGLMPCGSSVQLHEQDRSRWGALGGTGFRPQPLQMPVSTSGGGGGGGYRDSGNGSGGGHRAASVASSPASGGSHSSTESLHLARMVPGVAGDSETRATGGHKPGRDRSSGGGPLPREIRASRPSTLSTEPPRQRGVDLSGPPTGEHSVGGGDPQPAHHGGGRRGLGGRDGMPAYQEQSGFVRQTGRALPRPSRSGPVYSNGNDSDRWAKPAPRGRQGTGVGGCVAAYPQAGIGDTPGNGVGDRKSGAGGVARASNNPTEAYRRSLSYRPQASPHGGGSRLRAGGAPTYRSGSPAPTRGKRNGSTSAAAAATATSNSSVAAYFFNQQRSRRPRNLQGSGFTQGFKSHIASTGSSGGSANGIGISSRRHSAPSPVARDQRRKGRDSVNRDDFQRSSAPKVRQGLHGQRPATSEGLPRGGGGGGGGQRGRSPSPAARPSSASGRRRSASPAPVNGLGTSFIRDPYRIGGPIDAGIDRPRWK